MFRSIDRLFMRVFAPVFVMLRDVPASAMPRLFAPF
jgi:hypothetical protein